MLSSSFSRADNCILGYRPDFNEFVVLIEKNFKVSKNTIASNELPDCTGGKTNGSVIFRARNYNLRATLIIGQVFFSRYA